jgi:hypothetical protein
LHKFVELNILYRPKEPRARMWKIADVVVGWIREDWLWLAREGGNI